MKARRTGAPAPAGGSLLWVQGLACGGVLAFAPALALLLGALFWPVGLALVLDKAPGRPVARGMALCAAAASVGPIRRAWVGGLGFDAILGMATDLRLLAATWCAAIGGLGLAALAPMVVRAVLEGLGAARAVKLRAERARLMTAWRWSEPNAETGDGPADQETPSPSSPARAGEDGGARRAVVLRPGRAMS